MKRENLMDIITVVCIVVLAVFLMDGINLLTGISKTLSKSSMKLKALLNLRTRDAMTRNYDKTTKLMGIYGVVGSIPLLLFALNINALSRDNSVVFILLGIPILIQIIMITELDKIK